MPATAGVDELCNILLRSGSLKFGTFKLASGLLSPYYIDLQLIPGNPEAFQRTVAMYVSVLEPDLIKRVQRLVGVSNIGIAYAAAIALTLSKPLLCIRKDQKGPGREKRTEGQLQPGDKVAVLDDVITTGESLLEAAAAIRAEGGIVSDAVVLLDRQQGGGEKLHKNGVRLHAFATVQRIAERLLGLGTIDDGQYGEILSQVVRYNQ